MSTEIKIEQDLECSSFQCSSEVKLETDVIKIEVDIDFGCEENVESQHIKSEFEHVHSDQFLRCHEKEEEDIDEVIDVKTKITPSMNPVTVLTRITESQIQANNIFRPKNEKSNDYSFYKCNVCEKAFRQQKILMRHLYTHSNRKPYVCNVCNKDFKYPSRLRQHKFTHSKEIKPYVCNVCNKGFSQSSDLRRHEYTHSGEKLFICDHCRKTFRQKHNLQTHLNNIHYEIKPYVCDVCKKCFSHSSHLRRHKSIHTGEKPFTCDICEKSFKRNADLKKHLYIHSDIKPHICNVCNKGFSDPSNFRRHKSIHSKEK